MKREEQICQTRRRILDSALSEFSEQGYGASSINTISKAEGISKGIIYHYFETKDALYLACVEECFQKLTVYLKSNIPIAATPMAPQLEAYFDTRLTFFQQNPIYQRIFCDAVISPPKHLEEAIGNCKAPFDVLNREILNNLLAPAALRPDIAKEEVVETFQQYQDYINAKYQMVGLQNIDIREHEQSCHRALNILLYGVLERKESHNE